MKFLDIAIAEKLPIPDDVVAVDVTSVQRMVRPSDVKSRKASWVILHDAPSLTPPFPSMWMEYTLGNGSAIGVHVTTYDFREVELGERESSVDAFMMQRHDEHDHYARGLAGQGYGGTKTWVVDFRMYGMDFRRKVCPPLARFFLELNELGQIMVDRAADMPAFRAIQDVPEPLDMVTLTGYPVGRLNLFEVDGADPLPAMNSFFFSLGLMHCKNVGMTDAPEVPTKVAAKQSKKLGAPLVKFKILTIDPLAQSSGDRDDRPIRVSSAKAVHICRGNFATYSAEKPLFGKLTGTYWRPAHVRGTGEAGIVYKDYEVKGSSDDESVAA